MPLPPENDADLESYHHDKRWLRGAKPRALGRLRRRGQPPPPKPQRLDQCLISMPGKLLNPTGPPLTYTIKQLLPTEGWQARYADEDGGEPFTDSFEYFALCDVVIEGQAQQALLALEYTTEDGWCLLQSHDNFLALIPPWENEDE